MSQLAAHLHCIVSKGKGCHLRTWPLLKRLAITISIVLSQQDPYWCAHETLGHGVHELFAVLRLELVKLYQPDTHWLLWNSTVCFDVCMAAHAQH